MPNPPKPQNSSKTQNLKHPNSRKFQNHANRENFGNAQNRTFRMKWENFKKNEIVQKKPTGQTAKIVRTQTIWKKSSF